MGRGERRMAGDSRWGTEAHRTKQIGVGGRRGGHPGCWGGCPGRVSAEGDFRGNGISYQVVRSCGPRKEGNIVSSLSSLPVPGWAGDLRRPQGLVSGC